MNQLKNNEKMAGVENNRPNDVLIVGDSMIKRLQPYGHPQRVWKMCYPGATAEELHCHILTEKMPGEALIGTVMINIGTNDLSRSRDRFRTIDEVFKFVKNFILRMGKMYPQALIIFVAVLPRLDFDDKRVSELNFRVKCYLDELKGRYDVLDFTHVFRKTTYEGDKTKVTVNTDYYRNIPNDDVHLSDAGTQVQQDRFNHFFLGLNAKLEVFKIKPTLLMWQTEWERFNYWNLKTPEVKRSNYLDGKRITNFTTEVRDEILSLEAVQKTNK